MSQLTKRTKLMTVEGYRDVNAGDTSWHGIICVKFAGIVPL